MILRDLNPLPYGLALLALGSAIFLVTFLSLSEADVTYARCQWTALAAMLIATPALLLYVLSYHGQGDWRRAFWTAGLVAYMAHFWWAVFRTYQGDFRAIVEHQGFVAYSNFLVTLLWIVDAVLAWVATDLPATSTAAVRFVTWLAVGVSFVAASAVFRTGTVQLLGYILGISLIVAAAVRLYGFESPRRDGTRKPV
jgi:hypothetical protein